MSSPLQAKQAMRVLLVEDAPIHRRLAERLLTRRGCAVTVTSNGQEALELLDRQRFDLVLMDVDMPVMDGLTATGLIRQRETQRGERTTIVAVTAGHDRQRCLDAGMDGYIPKPLRADALTQAMQRALRNSSHVA